MRVVLDTNVILSALIFPGGKPDRLLGRVRRHEIEPVVSAFILGELERILRGKFGHTLAETRDRVDGIRSIATLVEPAERIQMVKAKDDDNRILERAVAAEADYLVTGDREHLLPLRSVRGIPIVSSADLLECLDGAEAGSTSVAGK